MPGAGRARRGPRAVFVGIDVGGTFTDLVAIHASGAVTSAKVLTTPSDQSEGVLDAVRAMDARPGDVTRIIHGTTIATNALLERTGARVALCATEGVTEILELRRQDRASLYDLTRHHPPALVPSERCLAVPERMTPTGVLRPLDAAAARAVAARVRALAPDAVAIALLHAYADPRHEHALAAALRAVVDEDRIVCSSDVLPEIREYERAATTVAEAYLRPVVAHYLANLVLRFTGEGYPAPSVMTSAGGVRDARAAACSGASLALSGPAGGVVGAAAVARLAGVSEALTIDIGGTSADVGLVLAGSPLVESGGSVAGVPIALPRVLVETVSAGGGSIGWIDDGGALRVGPRSAGARPGPAAFTRGGTEATITDAHLVLDNIHQARLSGGVSLDRGAARTAVERLAARLGASAVRTAVAMIAAADAAMARALRRISVERGVDPRRCTLLAFGGGGPLHACGLADQLGVRTVLVPPLAGVLSALGLAMAAERRETMASVMRPTSDLDQRAVAHVADVLARRVDGRGARLWWARARYLGQGHELEVPFVPDATGAGIATSFASLHRDRYGFTLDRPVEVVSVRHAVVGQAVPVRLARRGTGGWSPGDMVDGGAPLDVTVRGRAVIALPDATLLVPPGWTARPLPIGGWLVERDP